MNIIDAYFHDYFTPPVFHYGEPNSVLFKVWGFYCLKNDEIFFVKQYLPENYNQKNPHSPGLHYNTIPSNLTDSLF